MTTDQRTLSTKEIIHRSSLSQATLYRVVAKGTFPRPVKKGRANVWSEAEFERWYWDPENYRNDRGHFGGPAAD